VHLITRPSGSPPPAEVLDALLRRAEALERPAFTAMALGLRALVASARGDTASLLADASRAVALLDDEQQPALDRCTAYVVVAASLNTLRLWELVDELYARAAELGPLCDAPAQAAAVATNRVLTRLEWALALLENGDDEAAASQLGWVSELVPLALAETLLWESRNAVLAAARAQVDVERRRAEHAGLSHAVRTDALTGLANRRSFDDWLQDSSGRPRRRTALLLVDLDDFKRVNDTYGHECGDQVLRRIGELSCSATST
jgi:predicted signal transduction protein with EAL and GGDEF domain